MTNLEEVPTSNKDQLKQIFCKEKPLLKHLAQEFLVSPQAISTDEKQKPQMIPLAFLFFVKPKDKYFIYDGYNII
jgi:hypothetical protein